MTAILLRTQRDLRSSRGYGSLLSFELVLTSAMVFLVSLLHILLTPCVPLFSKPPAVETAKANH